MILDKAINIVASQINLIERQIYFGCPYANNHEEKLSWTGTIIQLVELIYALYELGCFNNGKISLKKLFQNCLILR